jgi:hypothetical protein
MTEAREAIARIIEPFAWGRYTDGLADQEPRDPILISSSLNKADAILALLNTSAGERDMTESEAAMVQKSYEASSPLVEVIGEQESPAGEDVVERLRNAFDRSGGNAVGGGKINRFEIQFPTMDDAREFRNALEELLAASLLRTVPEAAEGWQLVPKEPSDEILKSYGYAPGNYMSKCLRCNTSKTNLDKLATLCRECARDHYVRFIERCSASAPPTSANAALEEAVKKIEKHMFDFTHETHNYDHHTNAWEPRDDSAQAYVEALDKAVEIIRALSPNKQGEKI